MDSINRVNRERVLDLKDFGWKLLEQWKAVIGFSLIIIILLCTVVHIKNQKQALSDLNTKTRTQKDIVNEQIKSLPKTEQGAVSYAYQLRGKLLQTQATILKSEELKTDPYHARKLRLSWALSSDNDNEAILAEVYIIELKSDAFCKRILPYYGKDAELEQVRNLIVFDLVDKEVTGAFSCNILISDDADEDALQNEVIKYVENIHTKISQQLGNHSINCFDKEVITGDDNQLIENQKTAYERVSLISGQLRNEIENFSPEQKEIYERIVNLEGDETEKAEPLKKPFSMRYVLIGLFLGIVLYTVCLLLRTVILGRVLSCHELEELGVYTIGQWYQNRKRKGVATLLTDRAIYRCHHKNYLDKEAAIQHTSKTILDACKGKNKHFLLVVTAPFSEEHRAFCDEVKAGLLEEAVLVDTVKVDDENDLFNNYAITDVDGIVIIAVNEKTKFKHVNKILAQCNYYNMSVYGNIYLG